MAPLICAEQLAQVGGVARGLRVWEARALEGAPDLLVELAAVRDDDNRRILQRGRAAQLRRQVEHRQRLARSLRVPDHAAALRGRAAIQDACEGVADSTVLLVTRQLLHQTPALRLEDGEVTQDIEEHRRAQQPANQSRLALCGRAEATLELRLRERVDRLPLRVSVFGRPDGGIGGVGATERDAHEIGVEKLRRTGAVPLRPGLLVAQQLAHRLGLPHLEQRG